jgi:outer membrane protein
MMLLHCVCPRWDFWHNEKMKSFFRLSIFATVLIYFVSGKNSSAQTNIAEQTTSTNIPEWMTEPLPLLNALNVALQQNSTILKAKNDLESSYGIVVQTRAIALPSLTVGGQYKYTQPSAVESFPLPPPESFALPNQNWNTDIQLVQTIYNGKLIAAVKAARLTKEQALAQYRTTIQDTLLDTRLAYYDVLLALEQIRVHQESVVLLQKEVDDQERRYKAGTVPKFNVLRAQVQLANERPLLIRAQNDYRVSKNNLADRMGYNVPKDMWEDIPMKLTDKLDADPYQVDLPLALEHALETRTELLSRQKNEQLQKLNVVDAQAGYKPTLQVFAGYNWFNAQFTEPIIISHDLHGFEGGAQVSWDLFDGLLTHGKVMQAKAEHEKSQNDVAEEGRQIELQVRTSYSDFVEATEVLDSQKTVLAEAEESLREAQARFDAGTGTQLDVLDAETSLTQARAINAQALHDYDATRARMERAIGEDMVQSSNPNH